MSGVASTPGDTRARSAIAATPLGAATAVQVDGNLTDAAWQSAPTLTNFVQREPNEGAAPSFQTEARIAYDATNLYVAVRAFDTRPALLVGHLSRRDENSPSDWIRVLIDSYHDRRTAYEFAVNPAGVKQDKYWYNDRDEDLSWDAVWDVQVARDEQGWRAEFKIPFSQLRFDPKSTTEFGLALVRQIGRLNETSTWPLLARSANGYVSSFGELTGLRLSASTKRLELTPYVVSQVVTDRTEPDNPLVTPTDPGASAGVDLKYGLTPGLTLTATVNPDFGQVEADPAVVNLTAFETFFPERRPFFVEGGGIFRFDINCSDDVCSGLFYSRRIGRAPQGDVEAPDEGYIAAPTQTTIIGAAKVTGRARGFSIGALNAVTAEETAVVADGLQSTERGVEPLTSYSVVRARREFTNQSSLGFMGTATNRQITPDLNTLAGQAYTGGVDWDWRLHPNYSLAGYWAGSTIHGSAEAIDELQTNNVHALQRPGSGLDYDPTRTSLNGHSGLVSLSKIGGEHVRFNSNGGFKTPGFDINDVGFLFRADERFMSNWLQWRNQRPSRYFRSYSVNFNQWRGWNFDGDLIFGGGNINAHAVFANNWRTGGGFNLEDRLFDDRLTRGGPGGYQNAGWNLWQYVGTDDRKAVSLQSFQNYRSDRHGSERFSAEPRLTVRPSSALSLSGGMRVEHNIDDSQWIEEVDSPDPHYVFGHLEQTTLGVVARGSYTITPQLSIQIYAEPFVSAGHYTSFKELVDGRADRYEDRYAPFTYADNPDFNFKSFRTTNVLRWEFRPGSTLFVVWQQGRENETENGDFRYRRDFSGIFGLPSKNVFLVKMAYWINS